MSTNYDQGLLSPLSQDTWALGDNDEGDSLVEFYLNTEKQQELCLPETPTETMVEDEDSRSETSQGELTPRTTCSTTFFSQPSEFLVPNLISCDGRGISPLGMESVRSTPSSSPRDVVIRSTPSSSPRVATTVAEVAPVTSAQTPTRSFIPSWNECFPTTMGPVCPHVIPNVTPPLQNDIPGNLSQYALLPPDSNLFAPNQAIQIPQILDDLNTCAINTENVLHQISSEIRNSSLPMSKLLAVPLLQCIDKCKENTEVCLARCTAVESTFFLHAKYIYMLSCQRSQFKRQLLQIELYKKEIAHCVTRQNYGDFVFAALFIMSSPFPCTIKQNQNVEPIEVRLLLASRTEIQVASPVTAELVSDWSFTPKKQGANMQGNEEYLNKGVASFTQLKFLIGTGGRIVHLKFRVSVICNRNVMSVESSHSEPFIVMTNTKQWDELQGTLLKTAIFIYQEVSAPYFCNSLHHSFLMSSRLDPLRCPRPLSLSDLSFLFLSKLSKTLSASERVTPKDFDRLWLWLGPALQKIRYHKFLAQLWADGLFWGFLTKTEAEAVLQSWPPGTFLVRFSERAADGSMALAYKQSGEIRHYLIQSQDIKGGQGKSLPQFLREKTSLVSFLRIVVTEGFALQLSSLEKHLAMEKIGKRKKINDRNGDGYDKEVF